MMISKPIRIFLYLSLVCALSLYAQDTPQQRAVPQQDQIIDLGEIKIDARVELPQVQILDKRIEPNFEDVRAEKSFQDELHNPSEEIKFNAITSGKVQPISDISALLQKKRF